MTCPHCGQAARFVKYRSKTFTSLLGDIRFPRAYYHCKHCHRGHFPWDQTLRLSEEHQTLAAQEVTTLAGIKESFGKVAHRSLRKLTGLHLSESTIERTTEAAGHRLGELLARGVVFGPPCRWRWHRDRTGVTCAYVSVDATGILMQGAKGAKADGRMVYVGMVFNPQPRPRDEEAIATPCDGVRYLAGLCTLDELGVQLRRQAAQVGMNAAEQWIALSDAGNGLEEFFDAYFPGAAKVVDFRHATQHLTPLAKKLRPGAAGEELLSAWCHQLKHAGGASVLALLEGLERQAMDAETVRVHDEALTYFRNHAGRMNYPEYRRRGWQIGSGAVESACKNVINQRLSMGGMRWGEAGADALAHLRALYCSDDEQWDAFWACAE